MKQHDIKINFPGLLKILGANIYADPDAVIREMIQNAHDTCIIRKAQDKSLNPRIDISYDRDQKTLSFSDNGAGMTEEELHKYLATIGEGFTKVQRENLRGLGAQEALLLIGQFGIGILSAFSVSHKVEVFTRSYLPGSSGLKWICEGDIHYTVEQTEKEESGTRVVLHLTDSNLVLLDDKLLQQAIKKYADFLSVPIFLKGNQINSCDPPWESKKGETDYPDYIKARYDLYPLAILPFKLSDPLHLDGLLFVPLIPFELTRDFGEVDIYISRMFIKANDKELLPGWARFAKGVINTPDLTPKISRDEVVRDKNYANIQSLLGKTILDYLAYLKKHDYKTLDLIVATYNSIIKARSLDEDEFFDSICDLVRVNTDIGSISMKEYLSKSKGGIYYFSEPNTSVHKLLFAQKELPFIDASWGMEEKFLEKYALRKRVKLERLEASSGVIFKALETPDEKWQELERQFKIILNKDARAVAFEPDTVPAVLVARHMEQDDKEPDQSKMLERELGISSTQVQQMFQNMARNKSMRTSGDDTIMQLNTTNLLMQQLRDMNRNYTFDLAIKTIYHNAVMFAQHFISPENVEIIFATNNAAISAMIGSTRELDELQGKNTRMEIELNELRGKMSQIKSLEIELSELRSRIPQIELMETELKELKAKMPQIELNEHRACFFAFDYNIEENYEMMKQLQQYFFKNDLGIEVLAPAEGIHDLNILKSMYDQLYTVHFGLAEITGNNPNVFYEAGLLKGLGKPVILLKRRGDESKVPFDIFSDYRIEYLFDKQAGKVKFVWLEDKLNNIMSAVFKSSPELEKAAKWKREKQ